MAREATSSARWSASFLTSALARAAVCLLAWLLTGCGDGQASDPGPDQQLLKGDAGTPDETLDLDADREALSGRWKQARWANTTEEKISALETLGYVGGSQEAGDLQDVIIHDPQRSWSGLNLMVSGHAPEALLVTMEGEVVHRWRCSYRQAVPDNHIGELEKGLFRDFFRRAHLFENGDLLAIFEGHALIKLDAQSQLLWVWKQPAHHDIEVDAQGHVWVLTRKAAILPRINSKEPVLEDFIAELDAEGQELRRVSVLAAFENSAFAGYLDQMKTDGDVLHTNTLELVDERLADRLPAVSVGDVLISCLFINTIAVVSMESGQVVWADRRSWKWQHQPTVLDNGNLLLLDNKGGLPRFGRSRVVEFDPLGHKFSWIYAGTAEDRFQTNTCGSCQRLPNGNTLITESDNGRALEVTQAGDVVWEFLSPYRAGDDGRLVATLFEVVRLPADFPTDWLDE